MPTALITGATRGIGRAAADLFSKNGWDLLLVARDVAALADVAADLRSRGREVGFESVDLADSKVIEPAFDRLLLQGDIPSVLINNAGAGWTSELLTMSLEDWQWLLQLNLTSVFQVCASTVPLMREHGGLIINVSSHAARNAFPQWGAYCVSKAALASFTRCLAEEERDHGIRACTLTLGAVDTSLWDSKNVQSSFDRRAMLSVEQVAAALLHLAEQPSSQVIEDLTLMPSIGTF
ncbi:NAD(P)-dependent oxidoreductase [cyanobiont of Ornithocercus magnificus]|nr:NAD(P)-dependent oxidoreductase [cyanobiont of Ornithocercus magnificus]